jgi:hypothetical protein
LKRTKSGIIINLINLPQEGGDSWYVQVSLPKKISNFCFTVIYRYWIGRGPCKDHSIWRVRFEFLWRFYAYPPRGRGLSFPLFLGDFFLNDGSKQANDSGVKMGMAETAEKATPRPMIRCLFCNINAVDSSGHAVGNIIQLIY